MAGGELRTEKQAAAMADEDQPWKKPPIVQEVAAGVQEPPSRYVLREQDRPVVAGAVMPEPIPIVDISRLSAAGSDGHGAADEAAKLQSALQNWGLFLAVGHGMVEPSSVAEMMQVTREFFKLPTEEKQKYSNLVDGKQFRVEGYGGEMVLSEDQTMDWSDRFYLVVEPESRRTPSLWPTQPPSFSDVLRAHTARCREVAGVVLAGLDRLLGLREGYFVDMVDAEAVTYARLNYYPRCPDPGRVFGLKPHSDAGMITFVFVDGAVSGLQVQNGGVWYDVPLVPNSFIVNVGDAIEILSNGFFKSPVHRVVTNSERERLSLAMFYTLDPEKEVEPLPELVDEERPRRYRKTKVKDYIAVLFETLAKGTRALDTVKI